MRCKGFTPPEVSGADPYRVRYLTAFVDWPTAKVNVTRTFDLEFRVDSNYTVYKQLHELVTNNFNPNTENRRRVMQVKWGSLLNDLLIIERNRKNE